MKALAEQIGDIDGVNIYGRVVGVRGLMVEIAGPIHAMSVGARIVIDTGGNRFIPAEVIGFSGNNAVVMPFAGLEGVRRGCRAVIANAASQVRPQASWLGRVLNAMGEPIDGKGPLTQGPSPMPYRNSPPPAHSRQRVGPPLDLGVRALNTFLTCCRGQRLGIFAGSRGKADRKSTRLKSSHSQISHAGFCLTKKDTTSAARPSSPTAATMARAYASSTRSSSPCSPAPAASMRRSGTASPRPCPPRSTTQPTA